MQETNKKENIYVNILVQCLEETNMIKNKLNFVRSENTGSEKSIANPVRTELESISFELLSQLKRLNESIVI